MFCRSLGLHKHAIRAWEIGLAAPTPHLNHRCIVGTLYLYRVRYMREDKVAGASAGAWAQGGQFMGILLKQERKEEVTAGGGPPASRKAYLRLVAVTHGRGPSKPARCERAFSVSSCTCRKISC